MSTLGEVGENANDKPETVDEAVERLLDTELMEDYAEEFAHVLDAIRTELVQEISAGDGMNVSGSSSSPVIALDDDDGATDLNIVHESGSFEWDWNGHHHRGNRTISFSNTYKYITGASANVICTSAQNHNVQHISSAVTNVTSNSLTVRVRDNSINRGNVYWHVWGIPE